ncbi:hypothetical protein SH611_05075 [Geminicoccaceae bacterium 1502E]|nr:hypothetical protein [Geminicoccaceae bacterium 1502E]
MNKLLTTACAAALAIGVASHASAADNAQNAFTMTGSVADTCTLESFVASAESSIAVAGNTLTITADSATDDAVPDGFAVTLTAAAMCNFVTDVSITSAKQGFTYDAAQLTTSDTDFVSKLDYTAAVSWSATSFTLNTSAAATAGATDVEATSANLVIQIDDVAVDPAARLLSGTYSDTLTVNLGPAAGV